LRIPKTERNHPTVEIAADHLTRAAEQNYPIFFARAATLQAIHWHLSGCPFLIGKSTVGESGSSNEIQLCI
jgi:hypothetical protein